ncbi:hypothetical protein [Rugosimonospora africana]|uniref:Uncharacterized protein n=1 Tax=Rugosimonospora africana TaxID=556532 RepID=A0A8J3QSE4_9ACTN|nr:hypothetical protein [Rugosimonospora africana]GIH15904.1 hypothetical protein Raf01_40760 [Rugosimonospora africana]
MSLATETAALDAALRRLRQAWRELAVTVTEDRPGDLAAADGLSEQVTDGLGEIEAALAGLGEDPALADVAGALDGLRTRYERQLRGYAATTALRRALAPHGNGWRAWWQAVDTGLDRCEQPLHDAEQILLRCWREVLEQKSVPTVRLTTSR